MGDKTIVISFTEEQIKKYNGQNSKLCFSAGVGDEDNSAYNVIARSDSTSPPSPPFCPIKDLLTADYRHLRHCHDSVEGLVQDCGDQVLLLQGR